MLNLKTILILVMASFAFSCATLGPEPSEVTELTESQAQELADAEALRLRQQWREEFKGLFLEELLPEIIQNCSQQSQKISAQACDLSANERNVVGRVEWVKFKEPDIDMQARIDSGAKTSSLHAENIKEKSINGELYVQFETLDQNNERHTMVRRVVGTSAVKNTGGVADKRYVIKEMLQMGGNVHEVNVNLNDRSNLTYRFLVGRNLLIGNYVVDVSKSHVLGDKL